MRESYIDKTSVLAAYVVLLQSACNTGFLICSQVRHSGRSCTIFHALPQWIISLHVFEDDTVAKVTVSKANLDAFFRFVGPCPVLCCFAVLLCGETQIWLGDLRVVLVVVVLLFFVCLWFRDDLPKFVDHTCPCTFLLGPSLVRIGLQRNNLKPSKTCIVPPAST